MSSQPGTLGTMATIRLVATREIVTRVRSKAFLLTTALLVLAMVGGGLAFHLVGSSSSPPVVGLLPSTTALEAPLRAIATGAGVEVDTKSLPDEPAARSALEAGDVAAVLIGSAATFSALVQETLPPALAAPLNGLRQQQALAAVVSDLGGDPQEVSKQLAAAHLEVVSLKPPPQQDGGKIVAGFISGILLFIAIQTCAQMVATGVVEEKSSRVVELLLATIRPWQLMAGKVLGIGLVGLMQVAVVVFSAVGTALALGLLDASSLNLGRAALWALAWFVLGFALVALAIAALAGLVSRQEDLGSVIAPVLVVMIVPYMIGVSIGPWEPTNPLVVYLSYVPVASAMLMPIRIAMGTVESWEVVLAVGLSLALLPVLVWVAGRVYSGAVLRTGAKVRLRDALRGG